MKTSIKKYLALVLAVLMAVTLSAVGVLAAEPAGQLVIGRLNDSAFLDPNAPSVGGAEVTVTQQIYEGLVRSSADAKEIVPSLATEWEISEDGLTYTFTLIPDLKFSDGSPVTGEDWEWSFLRARDKADSAYSFVAEAIDTVESDGKTVTIKLKYQWAPFLADLCMFNMTVGSKKHFDKLGEEEYMKNPLGTGAYMLKEWRREEYILLEANPYYHEEGKPSIKEIKFVIIGDDNTRVMQLQSGQIDMAGDLPFSALPILENDPTLNLKIYASTQIRYLILNTTKAPFDNADVRRAVYTGIDKKELAETVAGEFGAPVVALVSPTQGKWSNADLALSDFDPDATKAALEAAGVEMPVKFTLSIRGGSEVYEQTATLLKSQLDKAGFEVEIERLEGAALSDKFQSLGHEATILQWVDDISDPSGITGWSVQYGMSKSWYTGLDDKELDELDRKASAEMDEAKRVEMYQEIQKRIYDNANIVPLFSNGFAYCVTERVEGLEVSPFNVFFLKDVTLKD